MSNYTSNVHKDFHVPEFRLLDAMAAPLYQDCPILVWMISLNRNYSQEVSITITLASESSILTLN